MSKDFSHEDITQRYIYESCSLKSIELTQNSSFFFSFIKQYNQVMLRNPNELYKFYGDESHFLHAEDVTRVSFDLTALVLSVFWVSFSYLSSFISLFSDFFSFFCSAKVR